LTTIPISALPGSNTTRTSVTAKAKRTDVVIPGEMANPIGFSEVSSALTAVDEASVTL
jgi:hypothetical protein